MAVAGDDEAPQGRRGGKPLVMYKSFYGLRSNPFNVNPDPRHLLLTRAAKETLASLSYGVQNRKGFILLTGEVGTGKTTLINRFLDWARMQRISTAFVFNPRLSVNEFLQYILNDFGITHEGQNKGQMLTTFNRWLLERHRTRSTAVLVIDEAQNLSEEMLEEIRLLTNLETATEKLLQIVLSGQPELEDKLAKPQLRQLRQRITLRCRTVPLTLEETSQYITKRLQVAGTIDPIFSAEAIAAIHRASEGIPRVINMLSEQCLITGYVEQKTSISLEIAQSAIKEVGASEPQALAVAANGTNGSSAPVPSQNQVMLEMLKIMANLQDKLGANPRKADS